MLKGILKPKKLISTLLLILSIIIITVLLLPKLPVSPRKPASVSLPGQVESTSSAATDEQNPSQKSLEVQAANVSGYCLNVPVLLYHHIEPMAQAKQEGHAWLTVDPATFDQQMSYLASKGYTSISADTLAQALITHQNLPKSVVLTFDDGYQDFYTYAYPVISKYNLTANLAIPTGLMNNPGYLNWDQLKQMVASGKVFAYDHTWSHSSLPKDSQEKAQFEILTAKKQLEQNLGRPVNIFVYPYGSENGNTINLLRSDGFIAAFSTVSGFTQCNSFIMSLHRNRIGNSPLSSFGL